MSSSKLNDMYLARRNFIKGMAAAGLLPALRVEQLFAQTQAPLRVLFVVLQHGWGSGRGAVEGGNIIGSETDFELPEFWQPFNAIKDECVFVDGLRGTFWGNAHDVSYTDVLTAAVPLEAPTPSSLGNQFPEPIGPSIDYLLEQHYNREALRFSARYRSWGQAYHPMSFNDRLQRLVYRTNAHNAYTSIFENMENSGPDSQINPALVEVFPHLSRETQQIISQVNGSEREKLLNYLEALGSLETRVIGQVPTGGGTAQLKRIPQSGDPLDTEIDSYLDMIRVAFANDSHRVAVLGIGEERETFDWTNTNGQTVTGQAQFLDFHQEIAHYNDKGDNNVRAYIGWTQYNAQKVVNFVQDLQRVTDVDGSSLLDNTLVVLTGEVGNGYHDRRHKPHILIGGGHRIQRGRWYRVPRAPADSLGSRDINGDYRSILSTTSWLNGEHSAMSHADLYVKIAQLAGMSINTFGIDRMNTGPLAL